MTFSIDDAKLKYGVKYGVKTYFMSNNQLTIGALAKACGVNLESIRYYHRIGLLQTPPRDLGSIRRYTDDSLKRVQFIKRAQRLGFTLDEVALLLGLADLQTASIVPRQNLLPSRSSNW